jgi:two-component system, NtrC family, response regulator PilR
MLNILVLDDESISRDAIALSLRSKYKVFCAGTFQEAMGLIETNEIDAAIIDINLQDDSHDGLEFLQVFKQKFPESPAVIQSGYRDVPTVVKSIKLGADDYLEKPFDDATLHLKLSKVFSDVKKQRVFRRAFEKNSAKNQIVGHSEGIAKAKRIVEQAKDMRILFYGETGVGKTPFACYSNQIVSEIEGQVRPFEQINCACLNNEHFQDQLFGHKKGAFTGAIADKRGLVELAKGGDLFLDEIGDMPLETQALFLTFLDSMEYYRLGDDQKRKADVRILCATNKDLKKMVEEGKFRKDLYSRISQVVVDLPPLRQQPEDIPHLFEYFVQGFTGFAKPYDPEILKLFQKFRWEEGNVRELKDAVEYVCIMSRNSERIDVGHLSDRYRPIESASPRIEDTGNGVAVIDYDGLTSCGLETYLGHLEKKILEGYLKVTTESLEMMAKRLKISRPTLYRRLKKYDISNSKLEGWEN